MDGSGVSLMNEPTRVKVANQTNLTHSCPLVAVGENAEQTKTAETAILPNSNSCKVICVKVIGHSRFYKTKLYFNGEKLRKKWKITFYIKEKVTKMPKIPHFTRICNFR